MLGVVSSAVLVGISGLPVQVEVHVASGLPGFTLVGHADSVCREMRDRVRSALLSSGMSWPLTRITVNLAPSHERKSGSVLDLATAIGLLIADGKLDPRCVENRSFFGEVGLDGSIRSVPGIVSLVDCVSSAEVVVSEASYAQACLTARPVVRVARTLTECVLALRGDEPWPRNPEILDDGDIVEIGGDLSDVRGQTHARSALQVAAAGGHHIMMCGPPGAGKSMLASRLPSLLPDLPRTEALLVTRLHSVAGLALPKGGLVRRPPFRAPHHSATAAALLGGGSRNTLRPGELSLASHGVLFLDELAEFPTATLDMLRQPLEDGVIRISRSGISAQFPASCQVVAAFNPCPCGNADQPDKCRCSEQSRQRYLRRLSGPLIDRFDLRLTLAKPTPEELLRATAGESSQVVRERVSVVRSQAAQRGGVCNAQLTLAMLAQYAPLSAKAKVQLSDELKKGNLSARGMHRVHRVARTIADLAGRFGEISAEDVWGAISLRQDILGTQVAL